MERYQSSRPSEMYFRPSSASFLQSGLESRLQSSSYRTGWRTGRCFWHWAAANAGRKGKTQTEIRRLTVSKGVPPAWTWLSERKAVFAERQRTKPRFCGGEDGIRNGRKKRDRTDFSDASKRTRAAADQVDLDGWHFRHAKDGVIVIVALRGAAAIEGDF